MRPDEKDVSKLYFFVMLLLITVGYLVQKASLYIGILITEFFLVLLPVILYLLFKRYDVKYALRLNPIKGDQAFLVIVIAVLGWIVSGFFALLTNYFLSKLGKIPVMPIPAASNTQELFMQILIFGAVAACCEEIFMRGLVMRSFEMRGSIKSIFITAIFFAMLHLNVQNFLSILFLGSLLGYVVYRTNSIFAGMIVHFTNNTISVLLSYFIAQQNLGKATPLQQVDIPFIVVIGYGIFALFAAILLYVLLRYLKKVTDPYVIRGTTKLKEDLHIFLHWPVLLSVLVFLYRITEQILKIAGVI